jgi:small subunit ribosomal protein S3
MGQKVIPIGLRVGINRTWDSRWFADKNYGDQLIEDIKIRRHVMTSLSQASVSKVIIERMANKAVINIHAARPGLIIGKKGADIDKLRADLSNRMNAEVSLNIVEVRKPELDAKLVADNIVQQIERRGSYKRAMKKAMQTTLKMGAEGIKIAVSGRLGGAEIARREESREGRVPLHTLRADIDYGKASAFTTYGVCGVQVWIFKGEIVGKDPSAAEKRNSNNSANISK